MKTKNPIDPRNLKSRQFDRGVSFEGAENDDAVAVEELRLRLERIFEEAEELWRWMYDE